MPWRSWSARSWSTSPACAAGPWRGHAKSGKAAYLTGYIGGSASLDDAVADFAHAYADQCEKDFALFRDAIRAGRIPAEIEKTT